MRKEGNDTINGLFLYVHYVSSRPVRRGKRQEERVCRFAIVRGGITVVRYPFFIDGPVETSVEEPRKPSAEKVKAPRRGGRNGLRSDGAASKVAAGLIGEYGASRASGKSSMMMNRDQSRTQTTRSKSSSPAATPPRSDTNSKLSSVLRGCRSALIAAGCLGQEGTLALGELWCTVFLGRGFPPRVRPAYRALDGPRRWGARSTRSARQKRASACGEGHGPDGCDRAPPAAPAVARHLPGLPKEPQLALAQQRLGHYESTQPKVPVSDPWCSTYRQRRRCLTYTIPRT